MKKSKLISLLAVSALSVSFLTACGGSDDKKTDDKTTETSKEETKTAEVFTGATQGTDKFETLSDGFAATGAWLNAASADIDASGKTLTVDGLFAGDGQVNRELALYKTGADHKPEATFTLTVDKMVVKSPSFAIAQGTVKGDVFVNAAGFHFEGTGKIDGNLIFASDDLKTAFEALDAADKGTVTGEVKVEASDVVAVKSGLVTIAAKGGAIAYEKVSEVKTGATAGTKKLADLADTLGENGAWLGAATADIDASGKTLTVDGTFLGSKGLIARKVALYTQNAEHQVTETYTLTADKLVINSPFTVISNGVVKGDVYVAESAIGFAAQNGKDTTGKPVTAKIDGNLYFATQDQLDAYNKLADTAKFEVTGETAVKAN
ncbi:hypothetical protein Hs30E_07420 [Lactococcus hodotermopsidis]|uniref:Lipoprotein n=1 Tax=Pseudolactococcus hodotermopsidis TaxID=2709157 RepID=A0A6A0BCM5_9LACT|nr:hypothetical protein [Lactococcus hodotermopsidis]GFH42191.1 hypothetical protein Hs30E_07420 [Lactococcus hodotermopsidis]